MITTRNKWVPYLFLLPGVLLFLAVGVYSVGFSILLSFYNWSGIDFSTARFEGLANFRQFLLGDDPIVTQNFYNSLLHNVLIGAAQVVIVIPIAIVLAFVLQNTKMASLYRTVYFLPMIASGVAIFMYGKDCLSLPALLTPCFMRSDSTF